MDPLDSLTAVLRRQPMTVMMADSITVPLTLRHDYDNHELEIVWHAHGAGTVNLDAQFSHQFIPDSFEIYPVGMPHRQVMSCGGEDHYFRIASSPAIDSVVSDWVYLPIKDQGLEHAVRWLAGTGRANTLSPSEGFERDLRATVVCLQLLRHPAREHIIHRSMQRPHFLAAEARRLIHDRVATLRNLDEIAAVLGVCSDHLRHVFKKSMGHSLVRELMEARISLVEHELSNGEDALATIAARCGFQSIGYLCRVFKQLRGVSPGSLRLRKPSRHH